MHRGLLHHFSKNDRRLVWLLGSLCALSLISYAVFLSLSVHAVVARKTADTKTDALITEIASLEASYVALDKQIDRRLAELHGFTEASPTYLSKTKDSAVFTLRLGGR